MAEWGPARFPAGSGLGSLVLGSELLVGVSTWSLLLQAPPVSRSLKRALCTSLAPVLMK